MKKIFAAGLLSAAMFTPIAANADTAELRLIGTITPAACVPNFTGGATIDYGNIPAASLNQTTQTNLPVKQTTFNVTCDAPTVFYFKAADERLSTVVADLDLLENATVDNKFGLGAASDGANIGAYTLQLTNDVADGVGARRLASLDSGTSWFGWQGTFAHNSEIYGFGTSASFVPVPVTTVTSDVIVTAALDKGTNLPLQDEIDIDGLATIEVIYP